MRILLVEDDSLLAEGILTALRQSNFIVNHVSSGAQALLHFRTEAVDLIILDLGLPDMDGLDVLRALRREKNPAQIMLLTARDSVDAKVSGLDLGADDYLTKPFARAELLARLRMLERRMGTAQSAIISIGGLKLDTRHHDVTLDGHALEVSRREYMLLKALIEQQGVIQTKDALEAKLYGWGDEVTSNAIEVHIHHLRKKLPEGFIKTVRGVGYLVAKS